MRWLLLLLAWSGFLVFLCSSSPCLAADLNGTPGDDVITVNSGQTYENVDGDGGNDTITNNGIVDLVIFGNTGNDVIVNYGIAWMALSGDAGEDIIYNYGQFDEGNGTSFIDGGAGNDTIYNSGYVDFDIYGGTGDDIIYNMGNGDVLWIAGEEGDDTIVHSGYYAENIFGDEDDDHITVASAVDGGVFGDSGVGNIGGTTDTLVIHGGVTLDTGIAEFEQVIKRGAGVVTMDFFRLDSARFTVDMYEAASQFVCSTVTTTGTDLDVSVQGGHWSNGEAVNLFSTGAVTFTGTETVTSTSPFLSFTIANARVTAARIASYTDFVDPSHVNPSRLAPLLDTLAETTSGDWDHLFSALDFLPAGRVEAAINQLGPTLSGPLQRQTFRGQRFLWSALAGRPALEGSANSSGFTLRVTGNGGISAAEGGDSAPASLQALYSGVSQVLDGNDTDSETIASFAQGNLPVQGGMLADAALGLSASGSLGPSMSLTSRDMGYWMQLLGSGDFEKERDGFPGWEASTVGVVGGVDFRLDEHWQAGVHTACLRHDVELDDAGGSTAEAWSAHLGGSAIYKDGSWSAEAMLDVLHAQWDTQREIVFNDLDRTAHADVDADGVAATVNGTYEFRFGDWRLTPLAGLAFIYQYQDDYTEDGAGVLDLDVDSVDATSLRTQLGGRMARDLTVETRGGVLKLTPEIHALWLHEFLADATDIRCEFEGGGSFGSATPDPDRDSLLVGASLNLGRQGSGHFYLQGDTELSAHSAGYRVALGFLIPF